MFLLVLKIFFFISEISVEMFRKSDMESGAHAFCYLRADHYGMFSLEKATETHNFFFVSFSKDVFLVLVKSETNRVTGKPNMGRTRVENRKEGKPWRAN